MSILENNKNNPLNGGLDDLTQQGINSLQNKAREEISNKIDNPVVDKIIKNKDTLIKAMASGSSFFQENQAGVNVMDNTRLNRPDDIAKYTSTKKFKDFLADKSSPLVYCTLKVDGNDFLEKSSFVMNLEQKTNEHDSFSIIVSDDALDSFDGYVMENSKNTLGKKLTINLHRFGAITQIFVGIIAKVKNTKENGYGKLYISGYSPSILLENGLDCQSYEEKTLEQIIKDATAEYPPEAKILVENPNTKYSIPYTVQYKESDYQFIKRLSLRYGEYFYYNGQQLVFGNKVEPIIELEENIDLIDLELEMNIKPQKFNYISYDSISAEIKEKDSDSVQVQYKENPFQAIAIKASKDVFKKKPDTLFNATSQQKVESDLQEMVMRQKESREHVMMIKGRSRDPLVRIGGRVKLSDINGKAMETYRILEINHIHDGDNYYNEFVGIPDIFVSPYFNENAFPECEEQSATVIQNDNPQGMIKVQFPWQKKKGLTTPWLRVITPYAGKGKGMHIIPEVGEEVIVGFDNGNAERPFVFGAMFNGKASAGKGGAGNHVKGLQTASGNKLHMNDQDGSVNLADKGGADLKFDGAGNVTLNANTSITFTCGGAEIKMTQDGTIVISGDVKVKIDTKEAEIIGTTSVKTNSDSLIEEKAPKVGIKGDTEISIESITVNVNGSAMTNVKGGSVNLN